MKFGFYSYDQGPGRMLASIATTAREHGHDTVQPEPLKDHPLETHMQQFRGCHAVLMGLSSHATERELVPARALLDTGIPVAVIEDTRQSSLRPKAHEDAPQFPLTIVAMPDGMEYARAFGYRNPRYLGPPPHWGEDYQKVIEISAQRHVLHKFHPGDDVVTKFSPRDRLVTVEGGKGRARQATDVIRAVRDAGMQLLGENFILHFAAHPGERHVSPDERSAYEQALRERYDALNVEGLRALPYILNGPQRLALSDLHVFAGGGPTGSIIGAYARKPMIYWNVGVQHVMGSQVTGATDWFVAAGGAMHVIDDARPDAVRETMAYAWSDEGRAALQTTQEKTFPMPEQWDNRTAIIDALKEIAEK